MLSLGLKNNILIKKKNVSEKRLLFLRGKYSYHRGEKHIKSSGPLRPSKMRSGFMYINLKSNL